MPEAPVPSSGLPQASVSAPKPPTPPSGLKSSPPPTTPAKGAATTSTGLPLVAQVDSPAMPLIAMLISLVAFAIQLWIYMT
ncbi:MAG: hypothetical protein N2035_02060 [Chthoniobacterales bacterium]|nr:hypothetical protein [Chthoniobacterales bacterium]